MRLKLVLPSLLVLGGLFSALANAELEHLPATKIPFLADLKSFSLPSLIKDDYETTAEFNERQSAYVASNPIEPVSFYGDLAFGYDADKQVYKVSFCRTWTISDDTEVTVKSGTNAMGAEWTWEELSGTRHKIQACTGKIRMDLEFEYDLAKAKLIRNEAAVIGRITIDPQEPELSRTYERPKFGDTFVKQIDEYTYLGDIDSIYVGSKSSGVIGFLDVKQKRLEAAEAGSDLDIANRKLAEFGKSCPSSSTKLFKEIDKALAAKKSDLVKLLQDCPLP